MSIFIVEFVPLHGKSKESCILNLLFWHENRWKFRWAEEIRSYVISGLIKYGARNLFFFFSFFYFGQWKANKLTNKLLKYKHPMWRLIRKSVRDNFYTYTLVGGFTTLWQDHKMPVLSLTIVSRHKARSKLQIFIVYFNWHRVVNWIWSKTHTCLQH